MEFDLVSAYSARASWSGDLRVNVVECYAADFSTVSKCDQNDSSVVVVNLSPGTSYTMQLTLDDGTVVRDGFDTCPLSAPCLENLYASTLRADGVYDTTRFNKATHDVFMKHFSEVALDVVDDSSLLLPFSSENDGTQAVTLRKGPEESTMVYDASCNSVAFRGALYAVGDKFEVFGKTVTVGDGSIVLVFSDVVAKVFPFTAAQALSVVGTSGSSFMKNHSCNISNLIASKTTGAKGDTYSSCWVHDTDLSTTDEVTRVVHTIDEDSNFGTMSMGVLHTDASANKFIEPAIQMTSTNTTISAQDSADQTRSAIFESTGLSFDSDESAVYFGASKQFRIKFTDGSPSFLQVQSSDGAGGYVTKTEFSDST